MIQKHVSVASLNNKNFTTRKRVVLYFIHTSLLLALCFFIAMTLAHLLVSSDTEDTMLSSLVIQNYSQQISVPEGTFILSVLIYGLPYIFIFSVQRNHDHPLSPCSNVFSSLKLCLPAAFISKFIAPDHHHCSGTTLLCW